MYFSDIGEVIAAEEKVITVLLIKIRDKASK